MQIVDALSAWRLRGVLAIGVESRPLLEMEVGVERMGPCRVRRPESIAAAEEAGFAAQNRGDGRDV